MEINNIFPRWTEARDVECAVIAITKRPPFIIPRIMSFANVSTAVLR